MMYLKVNLECIVDSGAISNAVPIFNFYSSLVLVVVSRCIIYQGNTECGNVFKVNFTCYLCNEMQNILGHNMRLLNDVQIPVAL